MKLILKYAYQKKIEVPSSILYAGYPADKKKKIEDL